MFRRLPDPPQPDPFPYATMTASAPADPAAAPASFEAAMTELETLVEKMEDGQLPLEQSLSAYQRGFALLKYCEGVLNEAQQRIRVLEDGALKDFPGDKP